MWSSICILRLSEGTQFVLPQFGAGCSLLLDLAIYRSVGECLQMLDNYLEDNAESDRKFLAFTEKFPRFRAIAHLNTSNLFEEQDYANHADQYEIPVKDQIALITRAMHRSGFYPTKYVAHRAFGFFLVCSYTPNLERFYNITKSMPVLPTSYIKKMRTSCL